MKRVENISTILLYWLHNGSIATSIGQMGVKGFAALNKDGGVGFYGKCPMKKIIHWLPKEL